MPTPDDAHNQARIERLEELAMFADHRHDTLAAHFEELSRQIAAMHVKIELLEKRLKDAERAAAGGENTPLPEDEVPPHNAF